MMVQKKRSSLVDQIARSMEEQIINKFGECDHNDRKLILKSATDEADFFESEEGEILKRFYKNMVRRGCSADVASRLVFNPIWRDTASRVLLKGLMKFEQMPTLCQDSELAPQQWDDFFQEHILDDEERDRQLAMIEEKRERMRARILELHEKRQGSSVSSLSL